MDAVTDRKTSKRERGLDRAFELLDFLRDLRRPANPNEIATQIGAPRSSVYELVRLLLRHRILESVDNEGRVYLGRKLYFLGMAYEERFDFVRQCDALLGRVVAETGETAQFCMLDGDKYTVVRMKEGSRPFRISADVGHLVPIPWTASGRLLLTHLEDDAIADFIPEFDFVLPSGETLSREAFIEEVREARGAGEFTFDSIVDSFTCCLAVPILNAASRCVATLCIVAPRDDGYRNKTVYIESLKKAAAQFEGAEMLI